MLNTIMARLRQLYKVTAWFLLLAIATLSLVPPSHRPETIIPHGAEHLVAFLLLGFAFALGYPRRILLATLLLVGFVGVVEIAQLFVPGRHARLSDFLIDAFAVSIGLAGAHFGLPHNSGD